MCAVGICVSYLYYGMLQEQVFSAQTIGASFTVLLQCLTNTLVAMLWQRIDQAVALEKKVTTRRRLHHSLLILTAFCYFVAMAASNESLRYVTYPTAVLAKSSKLIPTMVLGYLVERRHYNRHEWLAAACITSGVILFNLSRAPAEEQGENSTYGILLLCLSLVMDGLLGSCQGLLKKSTFPPTATETMLFVNLYAAAFFIPLSVYTNEWNQGWQLLSTNATIRHDILWLNAAAACGQIFIFLTITWYSSLMCTTITTTRKFFTILLSVLHFGHEFTRVQWTSVALVFAGLYTAIVSKARLQQEPTVMTKKTE
jgi:UDP-galactose transporter B1